MIRIVILSLITLTSLRHSPATVIETVPHSDGRVIEARHWNVVDISFNAKETPKQPVDVEFSATFENATGDTMKISGFYDGSANYLIRFTPPSVGQWKYTTESSLPDLDGLNGVLSAAKADDGRKGGIVIDEKSPTRFCYQDGGSYYPIAFEADWLFALDADNPQDIPVSRTFIDQVAENGFNQFIMNVFAYDVNWKKDARLAAKYDYGSPDAFPFGGNNAAPNHSQLNIDYFKRLDRVIEYLDRKGIAAHLMIYVWNKRVNWPDANSTADNRYFDYVVKRYQAFPNMIWDISKEALGYGHTEVNYIHKRIDRLRKLDAFKRLVTVHDYGYCKRFTKNIDFVSVQIWLSELNSVMTKIRADMPGKPILNIEHGGYERGPYVVFTGNYTSAEVCLERAYQCVFAGTYPTHYWQGAAWNVIIPDIKSLAPEAQPRLEYYRHLRTLVEKYDLNGLVAGEKKSNAGFCLHNGTGLYVYYVPRECEFIGLRLPKDLKGKRMTGTWFNPFDGTISEPVQKEIAQWPTYAKPSGDGFRVLVVEVQSGNEK